MPRSGARWLPTPPHARGPIDAHPEGAILRQLHAECGGDNSIVRPRSHWESARKGDLRVGGLDRPTPGSIGDPFAELRQQGLTRHLGVSNVSAEQLTEAQSIAPVFCVQNVYNVASRYDSELVSRCAREGIAYTPFFPLGGFTPSHSMVLDTVAARVGASPRRVALAWLLQHSPTILLIPGTSSVAHLRDNIAAADIELPADAVEELDRIGAR